MNLPEPNIVRTLDHSNDNESGMMSWSMHYRNRQIRNLRNLNQTMVEMRRGSYRESLMKDSVDSVNRVTDDAVPDQYE